MEEDIPLNDNNTGVPVYIHIPTTVIVITVFSWALEQACSLSIKHELFRIRIGVLLSNAILCVLSIVINFDLLREEKHIGFLEQDFVLIVRTLQIFWLFIAFLIGYVFVTNSISSAYKSSSYISSSITSKALSSSQNIIKQKAPSWMSRFWAICTVFEEIILFLLYIIAFSTHDILYFHICFISAFGGCVIGAILVILALIDILKYVYNKTRNDNVNNNVNINVRNLKKLIRLLITMIILCILVIALSSYNLNNLIKHVIGLIEKGNHIRKGSLNTSRALDNNIDYISYFCILICIEVIFVFWSYKPLAVNYCLFCCFGYKKYAKIVHRKPFRLDRNTLCYAFCKYCIDSAEKKRIQLIEIQKEIDININNIKQEEKQEEQNRTSYFSITAASPVRMSTNIMSSNDNRIRIILYDFDGVFTNKKHRYFEHWTESQCDALTKQHLNITFGSDERINYLYQHFTFLSINNIKIYCVAKETTAKINTIFKKLQFDEYFDKNSIIGSDHQFINDEQTNNSQIKLFILKLIKMKEIHNRELLYISSNHENVAHFADINLCVTLNINSDHGINQNDINHIQNMI